MRYDKTKISLLMAVIFTTVLIAGCDADDSIFGQVDSSFNTTLRDDSDSSSYQSIQEAESDQQAASFDSSSISAYTGIASVELNGGEPYFLSEEEYAAGFPNYGTEYYSALDELGRCGVCYAVVGTETMPTAERGEIGSIKPTGWHTVKYSDYIDGNYLYNRCHLLGYQLTAENANECNLITGTRYLNIIGMLPYENIIANYVEETGNHVFYRVTPIFEGENLLASGVLMEAYSIEDNGQGIQFCVYCYNVQPYIGIDYATGDSWLDEDAEYPDLLTNLQLEADEVTYILNTSSKRIHLATCSSVSEMSEHNKQETNATIAELEAQGYSCCKRCLGQ